MACSTISASTTSNNSTTQLSSNASPDNSPTGVNMSNSSLKIVVISGKVVKCSNGDNFSGVTVTASKNGVKLANTITKSNGTYTLSFQSNDTSFTVTASYPGHKSPSKTVTVTNLEGIANFQLGTDNVYVSRAGNDATGDGTQNKPYATIQTALDNVNSGGTIHLLAGTYTGADNTGLTINQNVTIIGENQKNTIINAQHSTSIFTINSGVTVKLENLTLTNGTAEDGGAICNNYDGTITLSGCNFNNNTATENGGAILNGYAGTITLRGCNFNNNTVKGDYWNGGAICNENIITLSDCNFNNNTAAYDGGAIYSTGTITDLSDCNFNNNTAHDCGTIHNTGTITNLSGCNFNNNTAYDGGAIYYGSGSCVVHFSSFVNNTATRYGNTIYSSSDSMNADYNWWGSNSNPSSQIYGSVNYSNWLYMTISVNRSTIASGSTGTVTVNFNNICNGTNVTSIDPASGHILDRTTVHFSSKFGTLDPATVVTSNGIATATFKPVTEGKGIINAITDMQTVSASVNIDTTAPTVTANETTRSYNTTQNVSLKINENGTIYYTTDGSNPTNSSTRTRYTHAISINSTTTLKYTAVDTAGNWAAVKTQTYTIDKTAPTISAISPTNKSIGISRTKTVSIKLSENILKSVNWSKIYIKNLKTEKKCIATIQISGNHIYIKTSSKMSALTSYQVYIPALAVKDSAGNNLAKAYTFKFKTGKS